MNATINGTNYHSDLKFDQENKQITIELKQGKKLISFAVTKFDLTLTELDKIAFDLLNSFIKGDLTEPIEPSLFS